MKLNVEQIAAVGQQIGAEPLPEDNPALPQLVKIFGDHTFYVGVEGLLVLEPVNDPEADGEEPARFIRLAAWTDEQKSALQPIEPEPTTLTLDLAGSAEPGAGPNGKGDGSA